MGTALAYSLANLADILITAYGLGRGFSEGAPEVARLIDTYGPVAGLLVQFWTAELKMLTMVVCHDLVSDWWGVDSTVSVLTWTANHLWAVRGWARLLGWL